MITDEYASVREIMTRGKLSIIEIIALSRPLWWGATALPFVVGSLLAKPDIGWVFIIATLYFLLPYNLLMYGLSALFDPQTSPRAKRAGQIAGDSTHTVATIKYPALRRAIVYINVPVLLFLALAGNIESNVFLLMMMYMVLAYYVAELRYKEIPLIDSLTAAFHYAAPFLFGLLLFSSPDLYTPVFACFYVWAVGTYAFKAIQDSAANKTIGLNSTAIYLGPSKTIIFTVIMYGLAMVAPLLSYGVYGFAATVAILPYLFVVTRAWRYRADVSSPAFRSANRIFMYLHFIIAAIGSLLLIYLYNI